MIVSAHQPNFAPWLGFFDKMRRSDVLVLLDTVQFIKRGYQNRTRIKGPDGPQWLTVPVVSKGRYDQRTRDVEIDAEAPWRRVHPRTLRTVLARAPHRDELLEWLEPIYARDDLTTLVDFNLAVLGEAVARWGIGTRLVPASGLDCDGASTRLMLGLTRAVGGTEYLSGPTGRDYLDESLFAAEGVGLSYHSFTPFEYPQRFGPFAPGLSCLDYLANVGFERWW